MCNKEVLEKIKGKMFKVNVRSTMLYGIESVAEKNSQEDKMQIKQTKLLRWSLGLTKMDKERNQNMRWRVQGGDLNGKIREK